MAQEGNRSIDLAWRAVRNLALRQRSHGFDLCVRIRSAENEWVTIADYLKNDEAKELAKRANEA